MLEAIDHLAVRIRRADHALAAHRVVAQQDAARARLAQRQLVGDLVAE